MKKTTVFYPKNFFRLQFLTAILLCIGSFSVFGQSFRTPTYTGAIGDFNTAERFAAAANNTTYAITFDATNLYIAAFRTSGSFGATDNFAVYIDTDPRNTLNSGNGTTAGRAFSGVTPTLAFNADYSCYVEQSYTDPLNRHNGTWGTTGFTPTVTTNTTSREITIPLAQLGNPASIYVSVFMGFTGGIFSSAPGTDVATSTTPNITGFFGSFPVYKTGITPVTFRSQNTSAANGGGTPISNYTLALTANNTPSFVAGDYGDISITGAFTSTLTGNTSFTGAYSLGAGITGATRMELNTNTLTVGGGRGIGGTAGNIVVNGASGAPFIATTSGSVNFLGNGLISGSNTAATLNIFPLNSIVTIGGAVNFGSVGGATVKSGLLGTLQINSGGSVLTNAPTYGAASTLVYNTGGSYIAGTEWTTNATSGIGVPNKVTLQNNTALNFGAATQYRQANGLVTIGAGSGLTLSSASGGSLRIAGGLTNNNTGLGVGLDTNGRSLLVVGNGTYTKAGANADNLDFLIFSSANTLTLATGTNLNLNNTNINGALQFNAAGTLTLAGTNTVTIAAGCYVKGSSNGSITGSSPTTSILNLAGICYWNPTSLITVNSNVGIQVRANLSIITTGGLNAGYVQIEQGGFVSTNPIIYSAGGTLVYNHSSGSYGVGDNEWPSATGGPYNVTVTALGGGIDFGTNNIGSRTVPFSGSNGTLTLNDNINLNGSGTPWLTVFGSTALTGGLVANATATINGSGAFTLASGANMTTANTSGVNGTLTTSGTKTFNTNNIFAFNGTVSQVTGALLPPTIAQLIIANTAGGTNGVTISNNTLIISGVTTLTSGALILPTAASNLVTFTGNISTPSSGGTITGSTTSNISTAASIAGTANGLVFTTGGQNIGNWTHTTTTNFGAATAGINSALTINGVFSTTAVSPFIFIGPAGNLTFATGSSFIDNGSSPGTKFQQTTLTGGSFTLQSGATFTTANTSGLGSAGAVGAVQTTNRTFSGGANYTFNGTAAQAIGDALDGTAGPGKTGAITGNVLINNNNGVTLNAGTTITINTPGTFNVGVASTSAGNLTAPSTSVINGDGNVNMFGNGATSGSSLNTAHANGVNGTFAGTGTISLNNAGYNNTNFRFNGTVAQTTGSLMPTTVNNFIINNAFASLASSPAVLISNNLTVSGILGLTAGHLSINGQTLTANGQISMTTPFNRLCGSATSNFIVGGSGTIGANSLFAGTPAIVLNDFTMNRSSKTVTIGSPLTISGTFSSTAGGIAMGANTLTLNGPIAFGAATIASIGQVVIGSSPGGSITGSLLGNTNPLALTRLDIDRAGQTLNLVSNVTVSNATGLTLTAGNINIGDFNLTNTNTTGTLGTGSTGSHIVTTGTGRAFMNFPSGFTSTRTFPIGDGTNYTPATISTFNNATAGTIGANLTDATHPNYDNSGAQTDYLSRYWSFTTTGLLVYTYTISFGFVAADINGTEGNIRLNRWNGTAWTEDATSTAASNVLTSTAGLTQSTYPLDGNIFTGRREIAAVSYLWNGSTSNDWATAANWTPSGVPALLDSVTIDVPGSNVNCTINSGSKIINNFTLNGTGVFAMPSGTSLTTNGTLTYANTATATLDCASTINIPSATSQNVPALNYGNLNLSGGARVLANSGSIGICGTFTPGAGAFTTTGSTIDFNGSGAQTIPVFNYNNLTISGSRSSSTVTLASGIIGIAGTFTPSASSVFYSTTGNTFDYNGAGTQTIAAFPKYNNLTISGARGGATVTLASGTIGVGAIFNPSATAVTYSSTGNTFDYTNTLSPQTITGFNKYNNLSNSGNGNRTLANSPVIVIEGTYTPTTGSTNVGTSTIDFSGTAAQTIPAALYNNLTFSGTRGTNNITLASSGNIDIAGTLTNSATFTAGNGFVNNGSTVVIKSSNTIPLLTLPTGETTHYNNLTVAGGIAIAGGSLVLGGNFVISAGTYQVTNGSNAYKTTVNGNLNLLGTGAINWAPTGTTVEAGIINLKGNLVHTNGSGATDQTVTSIPLGGFVFNGSGTSGSPQTISLNSRLDRTSYTVNSGTYVKLLSSLILWGNASVNERGNFNINGSFDVSTFVFSCGTASAIFNLNSGGTLITANATGVDTSIVATNLTRTFNAAANYEFNGTAAQNTNFPAAITTMNNLTINNSTADVKINKSINVNGNVVMTSGNLDLNGAFNISLDETSLIQNETNAKRIINSGSPTAGNGFIGGIFTLGVNPGNVANLGINFTTATAMDSTILQRFPKVVSSIPTGLTSISRVYSISASTAAANANVTYNYFDNELNGNTETPVLVPYRSTNANETLGANYSFTTATASDGTTNTVSQVYSIPSGGSNFITLLNNAQYYTIASTDWNTNATWLGNTVPPNSSNATIFHAVTVNASVTPTPATVLVSTGGGLTFGASGALTVNTTLTNGASGIDMTAGGTLTIGNNGTFANSAGTFTAGTGTIIFAGAGTVTGTTNFNNVTANGSTTLGTTPTINGNFTLNSGSFVNVPGPIYGSSSNLIYNSGGSFNRNVEWGALSGAGYPNNVVIQNGTTLNLGTFADVATSGNVTLGNATGAGTLNFNSRTISVAVGGNLVIGDGASGNGTLNLSSVVGGDLKLKGNWILNSNGTFTPNSRTVYFTGTTAQTLTGATTFANLNMNQTPASTLTINNNINIINQITFNNGKITTGSNTVVMNSTAIASTGEDADSYINGKQQWDFNTPRSCFFSIGDATNFTGVLVNYSSLISTGALNVSTTGLDQTNIASSSLDATKSVNRFYTLTTPNGLDGTFSPTFNFVTGDIDAGVNTNNLLVGNYNAGSWSYKTVGTRTGTSTRATGTTTLGDYQLAECREVVLVITNPSAVCGVGTADLTATAITTGSTPSGLLTLTYFTDASATTVLSTPNAVAASGTYYIKGTSTSGCSAVAPVVVTFTPATIGGALSASQSICATTTPANITLSGQTGSIIKWQSALDAAFSVSLADIANTSTTLVVAPVSVTTYYRAVVQSGSCSIVNSASSSINIRTAIYDAGLYSGNTPANWSEEPSAVKSIIIASSYTSTGDLEGCDCSVNSGIALTISSNHTLTLNDKINNSGGILTFENNSSLLQTSGTTNTNTGSVTYKRDTAIMNNNYDFTYWGSPVGGQILGGIWMAVNNNDTFYSWNATGGTAGLWTPQFAANIMSPGIGYIARSRTGESGTDYLGNSTTYTSGTPWQSRFRGIPNSGDYPVAISGTGLFTENLIANPYPSALDIIAFRNDAGNSSKLTGNFYFWTHSTGIINNSYNNSDYAIFNVALNAGVGTTSGATPAPDQFVDAGQGFLAEGLSTGTVTFKNSHRVAGNNNAFYRNTPNQNATQGIIESHKIWLNLTNTQGLFKQQLLTYTQGATNGYDATLDAKTFDGNNFVDFYSTIPTEKLTIQSKALPFANSDLVPIGFKTTVAGNYTIAIDHKDGLFNTQTVYLQDNLLNIDHNLNLSPYNFASAIGMFNNRFVLKYTSTFLGIEAPNALTNYVNVYKNKAAIVVNSSLEKIEKVLVYDLLGRKVFEQTNLNTNEFEAKNIMLNEQVLIVKVQLKNGAISSTKVVY